MSVVVEAAKDIGNTIGDAAVSVVSTVGNAVSDVGNWVAEEVIEPVAEVVEKTVQAAIDDPIGTAVKLAAASTGNPLLIAAANAGVAMAHGASPEDALKAAATGYVTGVVAQGVGDYVYESVSPTVSSSLSSTPNLANAVSNAAANVAAATVTGQDPLQALITSGANSAANTLAPQVPGYDTLSKPEQTALKTFISSELQGKDPSQALVNQALKAGANYVKNNLSTGNSNEGTSGSPDISATKEEKTPPPTYEELKKYYGGDIKDETLQEIAESGGSVDAYARQSLDAQSAADKAAEMGLSYEAQKAIKEEVLSQDVSLWADANASKYDTNPLLDNAKYAQDMSLEQAKAEAAPGDISEVTSKWLMDQETKDTKLWIQDQADAAGIADDDSVKEILDKVDSGELNAADAYNTFKEIKAESISEAIQNDPEKKAEYDKALQHAKDNGLTDPALANQWATDVVAGLKNYQDFDTIKSLPDIASDVEQQAKEKYNLNDEDAKAVAQRVLSGELNYNDALTVANNVSMSRELGYDSPDLVKDAPTMLDQGAELEVKALHFEADNGIVATTQAEKDALEVAKNDIRNGADAASVYRDYEAGNYAGMKVFTPSTDVGTNIPYVAPETLETPVEAPVEAPVETPLDTSLYPLDTTLAPVDYSLGSTGTQSLGIDPYTGTGLTAPSAITNVSDLVDINQPIDYSIYDPIQATDSGLGLTMPESPALKGMGGGQGLTTEVTDPTTGETGTLGQLGLTPEGAAPVLGDPESFINDPEVTGSPILAVDPEYLVPLPVKTRTPIPLVTTTKFTKPASNLPTGSAVAASPSSASDGTQATPSWKASMLTPGGLSSTYDPNQNYSFQSVYNPQTLDITSTTPLQQINPAFQEQAIPEDIPMAPQQSNSGYYNYGVEKSPISFDAAPFYESSTPQVPHLKRGGGLSMVAPLIAQGGVPHKGSHYVEGEGGGQDDLIEARLADGEYVFDADIVSALGDGSNKEGAKKLDAMRESIRKHKRSAPVKSIPPKAKSPLAYLKGAK